MNIDFLKPVVLQKSQKTNYNKLKEIFCYLNFIGK